MDLPQRIKSSREARRLTQTAVASALGLTRNAVSMWERKESEPTAGTLRKLAVLLGVNYDWLATGRGENARIVQGLPLLGTIAAGVWEEVRSSDDLEHERVPVAPDPRYPANAQYALKIRGNSVNRIAKDGTVVICVDVVEAGIELRENDLVWVERRLGNLVEQP